MGLTVEQVIERGLEEVFHAGDTARPGWDVLEGAITADAMTATLEGRHQNVPPDGTLEFWDATMEVVENKSTSGTTVNFQTRGYLGTTAAAHDDGVKVVVSNPYPRNVLLNGLKAIIGQLRGYGLYYEAFTSALTFSTSAPVELPAGAVDVLDVLVQSGTNWFPVPKGIGYRVFYKYAGTATSPPALQFFGGGSHGAAMRIRYKKEFDTDPFTLATDLSDTGVPETLQHHLAMGLAGHVLMGRDVPQLEPEYIPPDPRDPQLGSRMNVGRALWTSFISGPVQAERYRQLETNPTTIIHERAY